MGLGSIQEFAYVQADTLSIVVQLSKGPSMNDFTPKEEVAIFQAQMKWQEMRGWSIEFKMGGGIVF